MTKWQNICVPVHNDTLFMPDQKCTFVLAPKNWKVDVVT